MTHLETVYKYPDMAAMGYIQQFALLNQFTLPSTGPFSPLYTGYSYYLVSEFEILDPTSPKLTAGYFFNGGAFSNQTVLLAWEHNPFPPIISELLSSYFPGSNGPTAPAWPSDDYDTIWTVKLDDKGNLTVDNALCEGIDSATLPVTATQF
jgi:hypothetical protein